MHNPSNLSIVYLSASLLQFIKIYVASWQKFIYSHDIVPVLVLQCTLHVRKEITDCRKQPLAHEKQNDEKSVFNNERDKTMEFEMFIEHCFPK